MKESIIPSLIPLGILIIMFLILYFYQRKNTKKIIELLKEKNTEQEKLIKELTK